MTLNTSSTSTLYILGRSLVAQWVKDPVLSLLRLWLLLWHGFYPWALKLLHALDTAEERLPALTICYLYGLS